MQALGAAKDGAHRLQRHPDDVVVRLLRGQGAATGLGMEAKRLGPSILHAVAIHHQAGPDRSGGAELGHLLEEVGEDGEKE